MRKAISSIRNSRYTPNIVFKYDLNFEKQCRLDALFAKLKLENKL